MNSKFGAVIGAALIVICLIVIIHLLSSRLDRKGKLFQLADRLVPLVFAIGLSYLCWWLNFDSAFAVYLNGDGYSAPGGFTGYGGTAMPAAAIMFSEVIPLCRLFLNALEKRDEDNRMDASFFDIL